MNSALLFLPERRGYNSGYLRTANQNGLNVENYKLLEFFLRPYSHCLPICLNLPGLVELSVDW